MRTDETLYELYWQGEEKAADELVLRHGDILTLYINGYLKDMHEAEDLMIETFALMFARRRPVSGEGSFRAYLYRTARNLAGKTKKKHRILHIGLETLPFEIPSGELPEAGLFNSERNSQLYMALEKLKKEYQEALYLVYFEDMSYREAGKVLGKSESQVTNLVHRDKKSLREILGKEGFEYYDD